MDLRQLDGPLQPGSCLGKVWSQLLTVTTPEEREVQTLNMALETGTDS